MAFVDGVQELAASRADPVSKVEDIHRILEQLWAGVTLRGRPLRFPVAEVEDRTPVAGSAARSRNLRNDLAAAMSTLREALLQGRYSNEFDAIKAYEVLLDPQFEASPEQRARALRELTNIAVKRHVRSSDRQPGVPYVLRGLVDEKLLQVDDLSVIDDRASYARSEAVTPWLALMAHYSQLPVNARRDSDPVMLQSEDPQHQLDDPKLLINDYMEVLALAQLAVDWDSVDRAINVALNRLARFSPFVERSQHLESLDSALSEIADHRNHILYSDYPALIAVLLDLHDKIPEVEASFPQAVLSSTIGRIAQNAEAGRLARSDDELTPGARDLRQTLVELRQLIEQSAPQTSRPLIDEPTDWIDAAGKHAEILVPVSLGVQAQLINDGDVTAAMLERLGVRNPSWWLGNGELVLALTHDLVAPGWPGYPLLADDAPSDRVIRLFFSTT